MTKEELNTIIDDLLTSIDAIAKSAGSYEYGLPMYEEAKKYELREAVKEWFTKYISEPIVRGNPDFYFENGIKHIVKTEPGYTKEQIIELIKKQWIEDYGKLADKGENERDGYFVVGFVEEALNIKSPES